MFVISLFNKLFNNTKSIKAKCILSSVDNKSNGVVYFEHTKNGTHIYGTITGLKDGNHGFHIHESGNMEEGCHTLGGHYNPLNKNHGGRTIIVNGKETINYNRHMGDLGNIYVNNNIGKFDFVDPLIYLYGTYSIIGRSVIVHENSDDLGLGNNMESLKTGNSGNRILCGNIFLL